jgi:hypothetical protein
LNDEIVVPIDITQEEKAVLARFSIRQFFIVFPTLVFFGAFLIFGGLPFLDGWADLIGRLVLLVIAGLIALFLAFFKSDKYEMYGSELVLCKIKFMKSQKTYSHL